MSYIINYRYIIIYFSFNSPINHRVDDDDDDDDDNTSYIYYIIIYTYILSFNTQ